MVSYEKDQHGEIYAKSRTSSILEKTSQVRVEANWYDKRWGVGTEINDPKTYNKEQWQGSNDLGNILVEVKAVLSH